MAIKSTSTQDQAHTGTDLARQVQQRTSRADSKRSSNQNRQSTRTTAAERKAQQARIEAQTSAQTEAQEAEETNESISLPATVISTQEGGTRTSKVAFNIGCRVTIRLKLGKSNGAPVT